MGPRSPLLIGEAPTDNGPGPLALTGRVGKTMARLAGIPMLMYVYGTRRVNIFDEPVTGWDRKAAAASAEQIARTFEDGDTIVLLGAKVADAFDVAHWPLYEWRTELVETGSVRVVRVPHPSGRNLQLNDPGHRARMGAVLSEAILG